MQPTTCLSPFAPFLPKPSHSYAGAGTVGKALASVVQKWENICKLSIHLRKTSEQGRSTDLQNQISVIYSHFTVFKGEKFQENFPIFLEGCLA